MAIDLGDGINLGLGLDLGEGINLDAGLVNPNQVIPQQEPKGFFATLRNPIELMRYESLPVAAYQGLSGNTKEVQAKKAQDFIQANPNLQGTPEYMEAEAVLERYGYALSEQPFSFEALQEAVKTNPGAMAGEFVNAFMADPYLLFTPYALGGNALAKFMQANNILAKVPRIQRGVAIGTAAVPEAAGYSYVMQKGERGEFDVNRLAVETAIGGAGALGLGMLWGGSMNIIGRSTDEARATKETMQALQERANRGETEAITELSDFAIGPSGIPNNFAKQLDKNLNRISENNSYSNKTTRAIQNEVEETIAENTNKLINYNNETTLAKKIYDKTVGPVVATTVFGTGGYIGTGEKEGALYAGATALALTSFAKVSSAAFKRYKDVQAGKNFVKNVVTQDDFAVFRKEVKDAGIKLDDTGLISLASKLRRLIHPSPNDALYRIADMPCVDFWKYIDNFKDIQEFLIPQDDYDERKDKVLKQIDEIYPELMEWSDSYKRKIIITLDKQKRRLQNGLKHTLPTPTSNQLSFEALSQD